MQPIRTRYEQLERVYSDQTIFEKINREYFNNELDIKVESEWEHSQVNLTASTSGISNYYHVNGQIFTGVYRFIEYLQSIYDLRHMQKQINNIHAEKIS